MKSRFVVKADAGPKGTRQPEKTRVLWGMRYYLAFVSALAGTTNNVVMRQLRVA